MRTHSFCKDVTGQRFGKLLVLKRVENNKNNQAQFLCKCDCGDEVVTTGARLRNGTKSCGCLAKDRIYQRMRDITGQKFNRLTAIKFVGNGKWLFQCDCGNCKELPASAVRSGNIVSCGCVHNKYGGKVAKYPRLYATWADMIRRCENESCNNYKNYGAKGVSVCHEWHSFGVFMEWALQHGYDEFHLRGEMTIDRVNVYGDYCPENCRWADTLTQNNNTRKNYHITYHGTIWTLSQLARAFNVPRPMLEYRIKAGWDIETALTKPSERSHYESKRNI